MVGSATKVTLILLVTLAIAIPCLEAVADFASFDEFLKAKADEAQKINLASYVPQPEDVTDEINFHVHLYVSSIPILFYYVALLTYSIRGKEIEFIQIQSCFISSCTLIFTTIFYLYFYEKVIFDQRIICFTPANSPTLKKKKTQLLKSCLIILF